MSKISVDVSSTRMPVLQVGYQGENEATDVLFDISSWITEFGEGVAQLRVKRPGNSEEESYVLSLTITDGIALWTVSETDTFNKGSGKVQLSYIVGNIVKKAVIYPYRVGKSIIGADNPVDPFDSWIERSKAWAIGETLDGDDVSETDETYQNNAKYYAEQADILGSAQVVLATEKAAAAAESEANAAASEAAVNDVSTQLTSRMSEIETEQAAQSARMDTFTSLPEGSTSGNAELLDIRVGSDGTTYDSAGTAVRTQIGELKSDLSDVDAIVFDIIESTNVFTPVSTQIYPAGGSCTIGADNEISITDVAAQKTIWIRDADEDITIGAGKYVLCIDEGLYLYGTTDIRVQIKIGTSEWTDLVTATGEQTVFALENDVTGKLRISYYATSTTSYTTNWTGHIWINKGEAQEYMPVGGAIKTAKGPAVTKKIYQHGNLVDYTKVTKGYIKSDGTVQEYDTLWCSDYMPIQEGEVYCIAPPAIYYQYFAFYDESKSLIASYSTLGAMTKLTPTIFYISVPEGAKYFRCTFSSDQSDPLTASAWVSNTAETPPKTDQYNIVDAFPYTVNPDNPCDYSELTVRAFSKVVCIGDSLTYGIFNLSNDSSTTGEALSSTELSERYSYPSNFQRITGIETINKGDSGETSVSWYAAHSNEDYSQFDLAIIFLGVNDSAFSVSDADTLTAMQNIVTMLSNARSDMRIAVCSCIPAYDGSGYQAKGQLILNWAKGLNNPNIIPLDLARYSHVKPRTSYVAGHMSALGYYMMALDIARYISWYMDQHKRDFRFIQFIGSPDAVYDND